MTVNSQQLIPGGSVVKNLPANVGDTGDASLIPGLGRSPGEGNVNLLQVSCLRDLTDRGVWQATVLGVAKELDTIQQLNNTVYRDVTIGKYSAITYTYY